MDKKLTDSEIVKACKDCLHYEACKGTYYSAKCNEDILYDFEGEMYASSGCEDFKDKDLINRLQVENERLKKEIDNFDEGKGFIFTIDGAEGYFPVEFVKEAIKTYLNIKTAKAEAYKEFAERLKEKGFFQRLSIIKVVSIEDIDNLLKELVGDNNV